MADTIYFTPREVAERLRLRVHTVYDYIRKGRLPAVRLGNRCRIAQSDLENFLARRRTTGDDELDQEQRPIEKNQAARRLLAEWMADESGYDERVWPTVEKLLTEHPVSMGEPSDG
jgi:excisionase family DNA binding protein